MLLLIISTIIIGAGVGITIPSFMDFVDNDRKGSIAWVIIGVLITIIGIYGSYIADVL